ncbi:hypothetical protein Tco_0556703 [Tanacetum coccineum]
MVACLERTEENAEFHQIVDFLTTSSIHYALTVSPTIYASYIEQFWNTANSQTVNDVKQIHATVDGKTVVISESSVRSDLHFNDEDGITCLTNTAIFENLALMRYESDSKISLLSSMEISLTKPFNDTYETPKYTKKVFTNMKRKGKDFSGRVTPLFASMLAPPVVRGKGSGQPSEPQPPLDEAIFKERDDRVVRATTTAASLICIQTQWYITQTRSDRPSAKKPLRGAICSTGPHTGKTAQDLVINKLQKKVKRLEKALRSRTPGMKLFKIGTSRRKGLDKENVSKQGRKSNKTKPMFKDSDFDVLDDAMENFEGGSTTEQITTARDTLNTASINGSAAGPSTSTTEDNFEDEMTTIADTLVAIRTTRPRTTSVVIRNVEEEPRRATPVPIVQSKDKELAQKLFEEEQAQFEREQRIAKERAAEQEARDAVLIEQMEDVQARIDADELLAARLQEQEREQFFVDVQARFLVEIITARKKLFATQRATEIRNRPPTKTQLRN